VHTTIAKINPAKTQQRRPMLRNLTPLNSFGTVAYIRVMRNTSWFLGSVLIGLIPGTAFLPAASPAAESNPGTNSTASHYQFRKDHDPDGIGKFYMGREIAQVMGHQAADWLERPQRQTEERPDLALASLNLKPGEVVADIGAGTGYYTRRMAKLVGESGLVYAVDIQQEMLDLLTNTMAELKIKNVKPILGNITDPKLPAGKLDLALLVDVYHEFDHPHEMVEAICRALKPGGRLIFVEFRAEDPNVPIKQLHKMSAAQIKKEMAVQPLQWVAPIETLPWQHIFIFQKVK
jgi:ubiquinone/menaquinone biosynthesis C-methylase UbiE